MQTESGPSHWVVGKDVLKETLARLDLTPRIEGEDTGTAQVRKHCDLKKKKKVVTGEVVLNPPSYLRMTCSFIIHYHDYTSQC